jgi:hypothetical protein
VSVWRLYRQVTGWSPNVVEFGGMRIGWEYKSIRRKLAVVTVCRLQIQPIYKPKYCHFNEYFLPGCDAMYSGTGSPTFRRNILHSSSRSDSKLARKLARNREQEELVAYCPTLKKKAVCSSETSVNSYWTTRRYMPEDVTLHSDRRENLKSVMLSFFKRCLYLNMLSFVLFSNQFITLILIFLI